MPEPIAIIGLGAVLPGATDLASFWQLLLEGRECAAPVAPERWPLPPASIDAGGAVRPDQVRSLQVCHVDTPPPPADSRVAADRLLALDPLNRVALQAAHQAWDDAGRPRGRAAVIIGNIVLPTEHQSRWAERLLLPRLAGGRPLPGLPQQGVAEDWWFPGRPAALIAASLGLDASTTWTCDAACASSLYALHYACQLLREGRADQVLTGGLSRPDSFYTQMGFSALTALTPSGRCAPFTRAADGLLVGEGCGILVVKRLADAERDGDRIDAVIHGTGLSNDRQGSLMQPASEGQLRAMQAAYRQADWQPESVQYIECHGTGTPTGDAVELASIRALHEDRPLPGQPIALGSVKANVGHLLTAAASVSLIKLCLALRHHRLPPQVRAAEAVDDLRDDARLRLLDRAIDWDAPQRRAAISAFGFGGINAHVLIADHQPATRTSVAVPAAKDHQPIRIAVIGQAYRIGPWADEDGLLHRLFGFDEREAEVLDADSGQGFPIRELDLPAQRFRIPPKQLAELLPQQLLALDVASRALDDAGDGDPDRERLATGVAFGIGTDCNNTDFHCRWLVTRLADAQGLSGDVRERWLAEARESVHPALDAEGVMGHLGGIVASRVARAIKAGGPSFTVADDEFGGLRALAVGCANLRAGLVRQMVVGAADVCTDPRAAAALRAAGVDTPLADAAVALVLKREADALADGDQILALLDEDTDGPAGLLLDGAAAPAPDLGLPQCQATTATRFGYQGAVGGLTALCCGIACLRRRLLPGPDLERRVIPWIQDRAAGERRVAGAVQALRGDRHEWQLIGGAAHDPRALPATGLGIVLLGATDRDGLAAACRELAGQPVTDCVATAATINAGTDPQAPWRAALIAADGAALARQAARLAAAISAGQAIDSTGLVAGSGAVEPIPRQALAAVFPGSGNHALGMGLPLALAHGDVLAAMEAENEHYASQFARGQFWCRAPGAWLEQRHANHNDVIFGQVWLATLTSDIAGSWGLRPGHAIGYSLGETKAMFSTRAWRDRDGMYRRLLASDLFTERLAGACRSAREAWGLPPDAPVDWQIALLPQPRARVEATIADLERVFLLIENTPTDCVIGGDRQQVQEAIAALGGGAHEIHGVTTVHCPVAEAAATDYRELHLFPTTPDPAITYYSGIGGGAYPVDRDSVADSIVGQALRPFSFPAVIDDAWSRGARVFVELGPGSSCTRMIGSILGDRDHLAVSLGHHGSGAAARVGQAIARLWCHGVAIDPARVLRNYLQPPPAASGARLRIDLHRPIDQAVLPPLSTTSSAGAQPDEGPSTRPAPPPPTLPATAEPAAPVVSRSATAEPAAPVVSRSAGAAALHGVATLAAAQTATARAHGRFLALADEILASACQLSAGRAAASPTPAPAGEPASAAPPASAGPLAARPGRPVPVAVDDRWPVDPPGTLWGYADCLELAVGSVARVWGPDFAAVDDLPQRVRLPDEPLLLCHRIMAVEGERRSMQPGRLITEHDILAGVWYLDGGVIPTSIAIESGQADLTLSGWLGIDLLHGGSRVYRLLDAQVIFHRALPGAGCTIRYEIQIKEFFRQGDTWLFRFQFDGSVDGEPLLSMRNGCAGFFTQEELDAGQGIVHSRLEIAPVDGRRPSDWQPPRPLSGIETYDETQLDALRRGDLAACFGTAFAGCPLQRPLTLPSGRLRLVHRITSLDPAGGRGGIGRIVGEADIHPDDWFLRCHFAGDEVMPGTLMYECCLHTLRVFLLRLGWVGEDGAVVVEPIPGQTSTLRCRGQVLADTRQVTYRIDLLDYGFDAAGVPYAIGEALMSADGRPIVFMTGLCVRLRGTDRDALARLWRQPAAAGRALPPPRPALPCPATGRPLDAAHIRAFADGDPSAAFGDRYAPFDRDRVIARLPRDPYRFISRIVDLDGVEQWRLQAPGTVTAEYDVPADAWFFTDERAQRMPFAVLLEVALQPCGWLAAFGGAALTSADDLHFRNLGGTATQLQGVTPDSGRLTTTATLTAVAHSAGMIILHYRHAVADPTGPVYQGTTYFGFFTSAALAAQKGLNDPPRIEPVTPASRPIDLPDHPPFATGRLRMVDRVLHLDWQSGPAGLGCIIGEYDVDPAAWFFTAHFKQDPVCPGSLGLEGALQLLKYAAWLRWAAGRQDVGFASHATGIEHEWIYRGQIVRDRDRVRIALTFTTVDDDQHLLLADGVLAVDGLPIYQMRSFGVRLEG